MLTNAALYRAMTIEALARPREGRPRNEIEPLPAAAMQSGQLISYLHNKNFLPGERLSDLLVAVDTCQKAMESQKEQKQLIGYNSLNWFQKLFCERPGPADFKVTDIPVAELEKHYPSKTDQAKLFFGLCELHEHNLVKLYTTFPATVRLTPKGKTILKSMKEEHELPTYNDLQKGTDEVDLTPPPRY